MPISADRITIRIDAEVDAAVKKINSVLNAYLSFGSKVNQSFQATKAAMESFSGIKLIREATAAAAAVEKIGGVSRLTAKEQEKLNALVTEAIAKYTAMGGKVPPLLQKIADQTKKIDDATRATAAAMEKLGGGKLAQEANAMVAAVGNLGGATKLTAKEQEQLNKLLSEAIAKYNAMGQQAPAAMTKLWQETKKVDDQTKALQATMTKYSGSKMIQDANNAVAAVNKLGGATKLTSKEQQLLNAQLAEAIAKYKALGQTAPAELNKMWLATKQIGEETKKSGDVTNRFFYRLTGAITAADLAARAIVGTLGLMKDALVKGAEAVAYLAIQGSKVEMISEGFYRLQNSMEQLGSKTMEQLRRGTQGMVSDFNLMEAANRAMLFGLNLTGDSWEKLAEGALRLGRAMGVDVKKSFDDLVLALGRVSPRILDNLGIIVKVGEANQKWADAHGKAVRAMTGSERVMAFQELALEKILAHVKGLGEFTFTLADRIQQLNTQWQNFVNLLAQTINKSPVLREMFYRLAQSIDLVFGKSGQQTVDAFTSLIEDLAIKLVDLGAALAGVANIAVTAGNNIKLAWQSVLVILENVNLGITYYRSTLADLDVRAAKVFKASPEYLKGLQDEAALRQGQYERQLKVVQSREADVVVTSRQLERQTELNAILERAQLVLTEIGNRMRAQKGVQSDWSNTMDGTLQKLKKLIEESDDAVGEAGGKALEKLKKDSEALVAALTAAKQNGAPVAEVLRQYGAAIESVTRRMHVFGQTVPPIIEEFHQRIQARQPWREKLLLDLKNLSEIFEDIPEDMPFNEVMEAWGSQLEKLVPRLRAANIAVPPLLERWYDSAQAAKTAAQAIKDLDEKMKELAETQRNYEQELDRMRGIRDKNKLAALKVGRPQGDERLAAAFEEMNQAMDDLGPFTDTMPQDAKVAWMEAASAIGQKYTAVADDIKVTWTEAFADVSKKIGKPILDLFSDRKTFEEKFNGITGALGSSFAPKVTGMLQDVFGGKADASGARSGGLSAGGGIIGALSKGIFKALPMIGPLVGQLAGPIAAGIKQIFTGPSMEKKVAADLGRDYGQAFSEGLNAAIAKDAERLGDRMAASGLHLKQIIDEAGGVTMANVGKWTAETRDLFVYLERGIISAEEATKSLNEVVPQLAQAYEDAGEIWSEEFKELIELTKREGLEVQALTKIINEQLEKMSKGTGNVLAGFTKPLKDLIDAEKEVSEKVKGVLTKGFESEEKRLQATIDRIRSSGKVLTDEQKKQIAELEKQMAGMAKGPTGSVVGLTDEIKRVEAAITSLTGKGKKLSGDQKKELEGLKDYLKDLKGVYDGLSDEQKTAAEKLAKAGAEGQAEFDRLSRIALATFNTMVKEGKTPVEAMDAIGGSIDDLVEVAKRLGFEGSAAFKELSRWRELTEKNRPLLDQMSGLNEIMKASLNLNALTEDSFKDLQQQGQTTYKKLIEGGFSEKEALAQIAPMLGTIIEAHEKRGLAIDGETAKLIAAADQEGLLREKEISTNEILMQGLTALIEALGGTIPEAWKKMQDAAVEANKKSAGATEDTEKALDDVDKALLDNKRKWDDWAKNAENAAEGVQDAVDGVTYGSSPGGLKEWEPMLRKSRRAMTEFTRDGKRGMSELQDILRNTSSFSGSFGKMNEEDSIEKYGLRPDFGRIVRPEVEPNREDFNLTFNITSMDPSGVELVTERKILPAMIKILRRGRQLGDLQTILKS